MYPISLNLQGKKCIVFGAGKVAQRRVWGLLDAGAEVTVAAPEKMPACWETARLTYLEQAYAPELLEEQFLVFAATDDSAEMHASSGMPRRQESLSPLQPSVRTAHRILPSRHTAATGM